MDLTRLYNLTTPELREEAERLGVNDTYAMSRGQLIHAIRNRVDGPPSEGFFGKVLGFAKWALHAAQEEPRKEDASHPPGGDPSVPASVPVAAAVPAPVAAAVTESASGAVSGIESVAGIEPLTEIESVAEPVTESVTGIESATGIESMSEIESVSVSAAQSGPPGRAPAGVFSKSVGMFEEPFPTRTMARILAEQGHFKRSLAIYASLMREEPGDGELSREADEVRARSRARRSHVH